MLFNADILRGFGVRERILLALLSACGPLPTSAIRSLCGIRSMNSARVWLYLLKKRGLVQSVGYLAREDGSYEAMWSITEAGVRYLLSIGILRELGSTMLRSDGGVFVFTVLVSVVGLMFLVLGSMFRGLVVEALLMCVELGGAVLTILGCGAIC